MGYSTWSSSTWHSYAADTSTKATEEIFTSRKLDANLNPFGVLVRESRDSDANPESTPIIIAADVTGSMGKIADNLVRKGIGVFFEEVLNRKPVTDPHLMIMGIGDVDFDSAPLQVSQFESDITIATWLEKIYIEKGGGNNASESYDMPYYFAANHTSTDCWEKRGKKGYIFTIGDEPAPTTTQAKAIRKFLGTTVSEDMTFAQVLEQAQRMYNCYHIMIAEGDFARRAPERVKKSWIDLMGQNAIWLEDYTKLSEVIVSLIQVNEGESKAAVIASWSGDTSLTIRSIVDGVGASNEMVAVDARSARGVRRL